jgi:hypothetical protein
VTHEVIPAIRKTGSYSLVQPASTEPTYTVADALRDRVLPNIKHVPRSFFTVAGELFKHLHNLERLLNRTLDNKSEIEKSVGRRWSDYARSVLRMPEEARCTYPHVCPSGYTAHLWAYSMLYVADFDGWLWVVYFLEEFPLYVRDRAQRIGQKQISTKAVRTQVLLARYGMTQLSLFSEALVYAPHYDPWLEGFNRADPSPLFPRLPQSSIYGDYFDSRDNLDRFFVSCPGCSHG